MDTITPAVSRSALRTPLARLLAVATLAFALFLALGSTADANPNKRRHAKGTKTMQTQWVKPSDAELRRMLTPLQYKVTQQDATEPPFQNAYWNNKQPGIYVDITTGAPLFASIHKFDSGTGWPSFTQPLDPASVVEHTDRSAGMVRVEVRSAIGDAHLGHVFTDGPRPTGVRYCMNSAALRFVAVQDLEAEGYGEYLPLFGKQASAPPAEGFFDAPAANTCSSPARGQGPACNSGLETAILAGGCFWGMEDILRQVPGVLDVDVGYTGGRTKNPTYNDIKTGRTGHAESVRVVFDPTVLTYDQLLERWFFRMHDPTTPNRQGNDVGTQYRSAIFPLDDVQAETARQVIARVNASGFWRSPIVTTIEPAGAYTLAEDYHQDYLLKNPGGYTCHFMRR